MLNIIDILYDEVTLVGFKYHCDDDWQEEFGEGYQFTLKRDEYNLYDDHAVGVYDEYDTLVAYVSRYQAEDIWPYASKPILCTVNEVEDTCIHATIDGYEDGSELEDDEEDALDVLERYKKEVLDGTRKPTFKDFYKRVGADSVGLYSFGFYTNDTEYLAPVDNIDALAITCYELTNFVLSLKAQDSESRNILERSIIDESGMDLDSSLFVVFIHDINLVFKALGVTLDTSKPEFLAGLFFHHLYKDISFSFVKGKAQDVDPYEFLVHAMFHIGEDLPDNAPGGFNFFIEAILSQCDDQSFMERYRVLMYRFASMLVKLDNKVTKKESKYLAKIMVADDPNSKKDSSKTKKTTAAKTAKKRGNKVGNKDENKDDKEEGRNTC